jgi:hypothetical protein
VIEALSRAINPLIRGADARLPTIWAEREPLPWETMVVTGSWPAFRYWVWRSLLVYEPRDITHDVVHFVRLTNIYTGREIDGSDGDEPGDRSYRDLTRLSVLVLVITLHDHVNRLNHSVLGNLLDERTNAQLATWIFSHRPPCPSLRDLVGPSVYERWFARAMVELPDAHVPVAPLHPAPEPGRSGDEPPLQLADAVGRGRSGWRGSQPAHLGVKYRGPERRGS